MMKAMKSIRRRSLSLGGLSMVFLLGGWGGESWENAASMKQDAPAGTEQTRLDLEGVVWRKGPRIPRLRITRVSTVVPWPRGLAWLGDKLVVLARGRHRRAGGLDPAIQDHAGSLFLVDPSRGEEVQRPGKDLPSKAGAPPSRTNGSLLAAPQSPVFHLYDPRTSPSEAHEIDRPYCSLAFDPDSRNFFICGFSGIDLPGGRFRKNATDSVLRFDLRTRRWSVVESHAPGPVPVSSMTRVVPNQFFPHHDPRTSPAPHGWLNGPDALCVSGHQLFAAGKDNHWVVAYDLRSLRKDPKAGPPPSKKVLGPRLQVRVGGKLRKMTALGPSALAVHGGYLYVGYRTTSVILRFPLDAQGRLRSDRPGELVAVFEPYDPKTRRSANLIDMAFNSEGELFVSCSKEGRIWNIGRPDPERVFQGNDQLKDVPTSAPPYADLRVLLGKKTACGNILFDQDGRLFLCAGNYDTPSRKIAGVIYRVEPE